MTEESSLSIEFIYCACGCGFTRPLYDDRGRLRKYLYHHNKDGKHHPAWKGGRRQSHGYIMIWFPTHPKCDKEGYIFEHRLVMERQLGRYLTHEEIVHHKNKDTADNRIENLKLTTVPQHSSHHRLIELAERRKEIMSRVCGYCGSNKTPFNKRERFYIWKRHPKDKTKWLCNKCYIAYRRGRIVI